ncbi:ABC transporter permease [Actinomadura atramentaria]|uniref:ABC transporter permease n=1 Tax=Actinomadura atramentaria TaxID=1990 RepID=UPI00035DC4C2|nr:ABC transporter permease [Actinomadura atramentaria]
MDSFLTYTVLGLVSGAGYAVAAGGLVVTYATSRIFNIGHGAVGMVMAFLFWELSAGRGLPAWAAVALVVLVVAPLCGALAERTVLRDLGEAPSDVALVVTVALMVALLGLAQTLWPPKPRPVSPFFEGHGFHLGSAFVGAHDLLTVAAGLLVAAGLSVLLRFTRTGAAMRATVHDPGLLALFGGRPAWTTSLSWAIGASLAALSGILLTPVVQLDYYGLTLLVISAYSAAMLGRLTSLPMTYLGALALGLLQSYTVGYLPTSGAFTGLRPAIPALFLFAVLVFLRSPQARLGRLRGAAGVAVASSRRAAPWAAVFVVAAAVAAAALPAEQALVVALGVVYGIVMLSMVLLNGYGGQVSLAQLTFAGVGAVVAARWASGSVLSLVAAAVVAAAVGALVALPALRLHGLYLALATLAFGQLMDKVVFQADFAFGYNGALDVRRLTVLGVRFGTEKAYLVLSAVVFALVGAGLLALRRGPYGRLVLALRDSETACATLGLNARLARVVLFAASAGIAGLAGALMGGLRQSVSASDFMVFNSLPLLLLAVACGVTSVTGAALGGAALAWLPKLQAQFPAAGGLLFLVVGVAAVALRSEPNGIAGWVFRFGRETVAARWTRLSGGPSPDAEPVDVGPVEAVGHAPR